MPHFLPFPHPEIPGMGHPRFQPEILLLFLVLGAASLFEHLAMGLMFIGLGVAAEGSCLLLICGCVLFYGVFLPWAVKEIIRLCRQAAGYLSARA